jgi:hypothetical protein
MVVFTPKATGTRTGVLTFTFGGNIPSQTVPLSGTGTAPAVTLSPASLSFGVEANEWDYERGPASDDHQQRDRSLVGFICADRQ